MKMAQYNLMKNLTILFDSFLHRRQEKQQANINLKIIC